MSILNIIIITLLSAILASARVIKYEHNLEFIKYEVSEVNSAEEDHLTVKIYSIEEMESRFNILSKEHFREQQQLFEKNKKNSEESLQKYNEFNQKVEENISEILEGMKENLKEFENNKIEMKARKLSITNNYMNQLLTYQNVLDNENISCKKESKQLSEQKKILTKLLDECTHCKQERIEGLKREVQAIETSLGMEYENCKQLSQPIHEKLNELKSNMTDELINFLTTEHKNLVKIIEKFENASKLQKLFNDSMQSRKLYLSEKEQAESNLLTKSLNLNEMLKFDSIKPKSGEVIYNANKTELEGDDFLENFIKEINGRQYQEPSLVKWEKIHEKTAFIPDNPVIAGKDIDGATLYIIRACNANACTYGKYAHSESRKNAYVPYENAEVGVEEIELLTSPSYKWCSYDKSKHYDKLPVCRVEYENSKIPGTLQTDGKCRIGYGWKVLRLENNFEVLGINEC